MSAVLAIAGLAACGDDSDARYVIPPDPAWSVWAAGVDRSGAVVLTGDNRALTVAPGESTGIVGSTVFAPPAGLAGTDARGVSVDLTRRAWVLTGEALVPVAAVGGEVHPARPTLEAITAPDPGAKLPGAEPRLARMTTAVAVVGADRLLVASRAPLGDSRNRANVTIHSVTQSGQAELVAGRAWTGSPDRPAPATGIPPGEPATATEVDLDEVAAIQPLDGTRTLVVTSRPTAESPGVLAFFLLAEGQLRHLDIGNFSVGRAVPPVSASLLTNGRVVLNLSTGSGAKPEPAVLLLDAATGTAKVVDRSEPDTDGIGRALTATADGGGIVAVTSPGGDPEDEDNSVNVRIAPGPALAGD